MFCKLSRISAIAFVLSVAATGNLAAKTWTNTVSGLWTDAASWNPPGVPQASDDVFIPQAVVTITTTATVHTLTINGSGFLKVAAQGGADPAVQTPLDANATNAVALTIADRLTLSGAGKLAVGGLNQNANATLSVGGDLVLTNTAKLAVYAGPTNASAMIESGGSWVTVDGSTTLAAGSWIYPVCDQRSGAAVFFALQDLSVASSAGFDANERGFGRVTESALPPGAGTTYVVGGSHGGRAGFSNNFTPSPTYDSLETPCLPGGPSGLYNNLYGVGGGVVSITARDILLDGKLSADAPARFFGGAAGGTVRLTCRSLLGEGRVSAAGGTCTGSYASDGGGGRIALAVENEVTDSAACTLAVSTRQGMDHTGRRAEVGTLWVNKLSLLKALIPGIEGARIHCPELDATSVTLAAVSPASKTHLIFNNAPGMITFTGDVAVAADAILGFGALGTPYSGFRLADTEVGQQVIAIDGSLNVSGAFVLGGDGTAVHTTLSVSNDLALASPGKLYAYAAPTNATTTFRSGGSRVDVIGTMTVGANSWVFPWCDRVYGTPVVFVVSNLTVAADGGFNANTAGFGYRDGVTLAPGKGYDYNRGGGYGGYGGSYNATYGQIYGVSYAPLLPGSPNGTYQAPFRGGGSIHVHAAGTAQLGGSFTANGNGATLSAFGGPSGGSVWITAARFTYGGGLKLEAKGGWSNYNSGGGGGRIALGVGLGDYLDDFYAETLPGDVTLEMLALSGVDVSGAKMGTAGTAVLLTGPTADKSLLVRGAPVHAGTPTPTYGVTTHAHGSSVICTVPSPGSDPAFDGRSRLYCAGYVVSNASTEVASGAGTEVELTLDQNLTLTWLWSGRENRFDALAAANGTLNVNSATVASFTEWLTVGAQATAVTAVGDAGNELAAWAGDVPHGGVSASVLSPIMDVPRRVTAHFAPTISLARAWVGGTGAWFDPANWNPAGIPARSDHVTITGGTCTISNFAQVASLTLSGSAVLRVGGSPGATAAVEAQIPLATLAMGEAGLAVAGDLTLSGSAKLGIGGLSSDYVNFLRVFGNMTLTNGAQLAVFAGPTNSIYTFQTGGGWVKVDGTATIGANCWVYPSCHRLYGAPVRFDIGTLSVTEGGGFDAVKRGFGMLVTGVHPTEVIVSLAPGVGFSYNYGAGYGGYGGSHNASYGNPYGSPYAPFRPGSSSGYYYNANTFPECYGVGGGSLNLHCGRAAIHGTLKADGGTQTIHYGGSSGGGIWLTTSSTRLTLGPTAVLQADGGDSGYNSEGGGGRIAIGIGLSASQLDQAYADEVLPTGTVEWSSGEIAAGFPGVDFSVDTPIEEGENATVGTVAVYKALPGGSVLIVR